MRVNLTAPLRLTRYVADERQLIESPDCRDLVAATVRVLQGLSQISGEAFPVDETQLLALASTVVVTDRDTRSVDQVVQ